MRPAFAVFDPCPDCLYRLLVVTPNPAENLSTDWDLRPAARSDAKFRDHALGPRGGLGLVLLMDSLVSTLCITRRPDRSRNSCDHLVQGQDVQHQLAEWMVVVLPADVRAAGHLAVGEEHVACRVATFFLGKLPVQTL